MVELSGTFELDCDDLDKDHERLVEMVNDIVANLDEGKTENCKSEVLEFVNFSKRHFGREELNLTWERTDKADILRAEAGLPPAS